MTRPSKRRGALVGFGFIAEKGHLPAYAASDDLEIVAVADICGARRRAASAAIPQARLYEDALSMLDAEARGLDFVDVATPPYVHASIAQAALRRGLHVLCEKPLATSVDDATELLGEASRVKRVLFPVENYKHAPVILAVRRILDSGAIGTIDEVTVSTFRSTHARGVKEWNEGWRREKRFAGGGVGMDHGSHAFYLAFDWLRSYPSSVTAKIRSRGRFDTEDTFVGTATFPTGLLSVHLTWNAGVRKVIYTIHGDRGSVRVENDEIEVSLKNGELFKQTIASEWMDAGHSAWFTSMFERFKRAMEEKQYVGRPAVNALRCVELIAAAYDSANDASRERPLRYRG